MICVDSSVAAQWVFPEDWSDRAEALLSEATSSGRTIVAPALFRFEITNIVRQRVRRLGMPWEEADDVLHRLLSFPVEPRQPADLHQRALRLTNHYGLPAAYDAHYVVIAQEYGCDLWTDDQRLLRTLGHAFPFVRWIGDFQIENSSN
ncbi:MAG: type II toxin-antitoxin system VapC family toxin [Thermomicrobiales bacterium]